MFGDVELDVNLRSFRSQEDLGSIGHLERSVFQVDALNGKLGSFFLRCGLGSGVFVFCHF